MVLAPDPDPGPGPGPNPGLWLVLTLRKFPPAPPEVGMFFFFRLSQGPSGGWDAIAISIQNDNVFDRNGAVSTKTPQDLKTPRKKSYCKDTWLLNILKLWDAIENQILFAGNLFFHCFYV